MTGATGTHGAEGRPVKRLICKKGLRGYEFFVHKKYYTLYDTFNMFGSGTGGDTGSPPVTEPDLLMYQSSDNACVLLDNSNT